MKETIITTLILNFWAIILIFLARIEKKKKHITKLKSHVIFNGVIIGLPWLVIIIVILLDHFNSLYNLLVDLLLVVYASDFILLLIETFYLYFKPAFSKLKFCYVLLGALISYFVIASLGFWFELMLKKYIQTVSTPATTISFLSIIGALYSVVQSIVSYCSDYNEYISTRVKDDSLCLSEKKNKRAKDKNFHLKLYELIIKCIGVLYPIFIVLLIYKFFSKSFEMHMLKQSINFDYLLTSNILNYANMALFILLITSLIFIILFTIINKLMKKSYHIKRD